MTETIRIGVVGAGAIAQLAHLPVLAKMRGAELAALCDNDRPKARALADRFGIPDVFTDIDDLLEVEGLQAVVVATPNHLHEPHVLAALAAKRHVLCERPLSLTARETEVLQVLAAAHPRPVRREVVYRMVWGWAMPRGDRTVDVNVKRLRDKLRTHPGVGYALELQGAAEVVTGL